MDSFSSSVLRHIHHGHTVRSIDWSVVILITQALIDQQIYHEKHYATDINLKIATFIHGLYPEDYYAWLLKEQRRLQSAGS